MYGSIKTVALVFWIVVLVVLGLAVAADAEGVPERSAGGQTLRVPDEHLDEGMIYHVVPGEDSQIVFESDARFQKVVGTSRRVVGYLVSPFDAEEGASPVTVGAFRLPVASLSTGAKQADDFLRGATFFDAKTYPEILFRVTGADSAKVKETDDEFVTTTVLLRGELTIKDKTVPVDVECELSSMPCNRRTFARGVGDFLSVRGSFQVEAQQFGLQMPAPTFRERMAQTFDVDLFLMLCTVSPEKSLDPNVDRKQHTKRLRFLTLVRDLDDPEQGYAYGRKLLKEAGDSWKACDVLASLTVNEDGIKTRDLNFALEAATRANELSGHKRPEALLTLAMVHDERGEDEKAVTVAKKAMELVTDETPPPVKAQIEGLVGRLSGTGTQ